MISSNTAQCSKMKHCEMINCVCTGPCLHSYPEGEHFPNLSRLLLSPCSSHLEMETADSLSCSTFSCCQHHAPACRVQRARAACSPDPASGWGQRGQKRRWGWEEGLQKSPQVGISAVQAAQSVSSWRGYIIFPWCCTLPKSCSTHEPVWPQIYSNAPSSAQ